MQFPLSTLAPLQQRPDIRAVTSAFRRPGGGPRKALRDAETGVQLSPDVVETHRATFESAGLAPPTRWSAAELSQIVLNHPSRLSDLVAALLRAVEAKPVLLDIGIGQLELGQLQMIYRREVSAWPNGASADALLEGESASCAPARLHECVENSDTQGFADVDCRHKLSTLPVRVTWADLGAG